MNNNKIAAYIRVSDIKKGDGSTQRNDITEYCIQKGLTIDKWVEEHISATKTDVEERELMKIVNDGFSIVMTDISRLGRRGAFELMGVIGQICKQGELHLTYTDRIVNKKNKDDAETIFTIVGSSFAAVDEGIKRSQRAKAAINRRTTNGLSNGRQVGAKVRSKLDDHALFIIDSINNNVSKVKIMKDLDSIHGCKVAKMTFYTWLGKRGIVTNNARV